MQIVFFVTISEQPTSVEGCELIIFPLRVSYNILKMNYNTVVVVTVYNEPCQHGFITTALALSRLI